MKLSFIKNLLESCNVGLLIGSGCSLPYLPTLNNVERLLTKLNDSDLEEKQSQLIKASIYKKYFEQVIVPNTRKTINEGKKVVVDPVKKTTKYDQYSFTLDTYQKFVKSLNHILLFRYNNLLSKQINVYTTNIDLFLERSIEQSGLELNDGFKGRIEPVYDLSNFNKSYSKRSSHYENVSEIPVFNLVKLHGSVNWEKKDEGITSNRNSLVVDKIIKELNKFDNDDFVEFEETADFKDLLEKLEDFDEDKIKDFSLLIESYSKLIIVNPTKEKFYTSVFEEQYYEMMRIFANSLEKENSVLFVSGFSFADEHISKITNRLADANPTLQIVIFCYSDTVTGCISKNFLEIVEKSSNRNITLLTPEAFIKSNEEEDKDLKSRVKNFDLQTIDKEVFFKIASSLGLKISLK